MQTRPTFSRAVAVTALVLMAGCDLGNPSPQPSSDGTTAALPSALPTSEPTVTPSPTPAIPESFPLAVVTGFTNLKPNITLDELTTLANAGQLLVPCGIQVDAPAIAAPADCVPAPEIVDAVEADAAAVAVLPPGLVEPATKVLPIAGDGPFGLFGPNLFGDPESRALDYPVTGSASGDGSELDRAWVEHDPEQIWTLTNIGSLCADRGAAYQAVTLGNGWDWAFGGGTAEYAAPAVIDPPNEGPYYPVAPVETGNDGVTASILERSDVAIADHECPVMPTANWAPNLGATLFFSVPEDVVPFWKDTLGLDAIYLAANHMSDRGPEGIQSTVDILDQYEIPRTGLGMNLDEALEPAYVDVAGLKVAFVAFNDVPGVAEATADVPGAAWINEANINEAVGRAEAGGADLVICNPQWWGGAEYHDDLWPTQVEQLGWFDAAGCDHVIGSGTHVAGPILLGPREEGGPRLVLASPGNYMFGQDWWQETQEGVIIDMTFRGTELVNARLHPTVQILGARPALLDPEGDGNYVLNRMWLYADLDYRR
jgi:poly-gamma-glutamate capsule biosynthesis protein CapA/YwtB (metallophosphatase superfamily)